MKLYSTKKITLTRSKRTVQGGGFRLPTTMHVESPYPQPQTGSGTTNIDRLKESLAKLSLGSNNPKRFVNINN